jgi:hypothetical protein
MHSARPRGPPKSGDPTDAPRLIDQVYCFRIKWLILDYRSHTLTPDAIEQRVSSSKRAHADDIRVDTIDKDSVTACMSRHED